MLALRVLDWGRDGRLVNLTSGEIIPAQASARVLLKALLGRQLAFEDAVLAEARQHKTAVFTLQGVGGWNSLAMPRRCVEAASIANEGVHLGEV